VDSTSFGLVEESKTEKNGRQTGTETRSDGFLKRTIDSTADWILCQCIATGYGHRGRSFGTAISTEKSRLAGLSESSCHKVIDPVTIKRVIESEGVVEGWKEILRARLLRIYDQARLMIRVVTFDAAGTLIRLTRPPGLTYADCARGFGHELDPESVEAAFRTVWHTLAPPEESAGPRADDDYGWWKALVDRTMQLAGYRITSFDAYFDDVYAAFTRPGIWELFPDIPALLTELAGLGIRLGVISNFDRRLYVILQNLNVLQAFENVIISSEIGASKPAPRIFLEAARRFRVEPGEILHIGDDADLDEKGAIAAGCKAFVVGHDSNRMKGLTGSLQ
jgi:putative hydrolase of the HAD superfamily